MRTSLIAMMLLLAGCAADDPKLRTYDNNELEMAPAYAALNACSCLFVMEMDRAYCDDLIRISPEVTKISVDTAAKSVTGMAFISWTARARFVDARRGCVLE